MTKTLFTPIVPEEKLGPFFNHIRSSPGSEPTRWMMDSIYQTFEDPDGNFLEQFQTSGFDARVFELYLFAYFTRAGFDVERARPNPDFVISRNGVRVAIEATTVNPSESGTVRDFGKQLSTLSEDELRCYHRNELPIRFGSPLGSKLKKRYWELERCRDLPLVIAIEAFHDEEALLLSDSSLSSYLYGVEQIGLTSANGSIKTRTVAISGHSLGPKTIPSSFFQQADAENISAVLFTNTGTAARFSRMGYLHGIGNRNIEMVRTGFCFDPAPEALDAAFFSYSLSQPPLVETWGQGLVLLKNPSAVHPLPDDFFTGAVEMDFVQGRIETKHQNWHPISSKTNTFFVEDIEMAMALPRPAPAITIGSIGKAAFGRLVGFSLAENHPLGEEQGWFADDTESFVGTVLLDRVDGDWGWVVLARDECFGFRWIDGKSSIPTRLAACASLQLRIADFLSRPQRIFPQ